MLGRIKGDEAQRLAGVTGERIEARQRIDLIAKEFDAVWQLARDGKYIENAAAHAHLAALLNHEFAVVAEFIEGDYELFEIAFFACG